MTVWIDALVQIPERVVIALRKNDFGKLRRVRAEYIRKFEVEAPDDFEVEECDYNETDGNHYCKEGWYETADSDDQMWRIGGVTHWTDLPELPQDCGADKGAAIPVGVHGPSLSDIGIADIEIDGAAGATKNPTVLWIVEQCLKANGYDGLHYDDICGCFMDDLCPCDEINQWCCAGHRVTLDDGTEGIGPKTGKE